MKYLHHHHHHKHQYNKLLILHHHHHKSPIQQTPHTVSTIKLHILKKGEYDIWAMKMEHYLAHTDYPIWEVIQNGNGPVSITTDTQGQIKVLPPRTAEEILARERERKARTTLLMALPEDHLAKFHKMTDAKEMWDAIISRFGGNDEPKKMQKFQSLLSQLEIHGGVSTEDENQKFLRSLPSAWSQVSLIMRTKPGVDSLSFDDLYNNLRVFENDVKGSIVSASSTQNVAFVSKNTSSTNDVSTAYSVSNPSGQNSQTKGNQDSRRRDAWNSGNKDGRRSGKQEDSKALVTIDGEGVDWTSHSEEEEDYALMACNSSGSNTEAYTEGLKKVEAQLVAHQQGQLWYEEKIRFMKIDLDDKTDVLTYHKKLLAEAQKEKEDLKAKVEKWHNSSKNLGKLLNTQMSANDKFGLGYGDHRYDGILSYENEVLQSVFMNKESELEKQPLYDRFVTAGGMHAVIPPMTRNYMPSGPDVEIDYSKFTYGPKQSQPSEFETQTSDFDTCESECSVQTYESLPEPTVIEPKVVDQPKVWSDAPIIEEYESNSEDEHNQLTHRKNPRVDKKGLGYGFTARACFVCGSLSHLIRDCDFHEKRMAKQAELNNSMRKKSSQREIRPIWNNVQRVNYKNQFVPTVVLTRTGKIPVNTARASGTNNVSTARHDFNRQAVPTNATVKVNIVKPIVNKVRPANVNTAQVNAVSAIGGKRETVVKSSADYPHRALKHKGIVDSGCFRHMTENKAYLQDFHGGPVAFGGSKGYITGKGKIKTRKLDFEDVCFVKELQHFNLFSVSQICDKKNKVLFTDSECLVLSPEFKLPDENQVLLRIPRQNNMYSFNLENIVPLGGLAFLIAKATIDESNKWHRRLGHVNFKNLNKLVKGNLVRGLPSNIFQNDHTCVACQKGKQHKASCKAKSVSSISHSLQLLHMDLFGPISIRSINHKTYCLVITDDFSRDFIEFCGSKSIKREYSNARTLQQNGVAKRKNRTLIETARTMLADSFLPNTFWAEAVSTACYVLQSKAFRVYNLETKRVEENLHITFLENKPNVAGKGPTWLFDLDYLTDSMNYQPVRSENQANKHAGPQEANHNAGTQDNIDAGDSEKEDESAQDYFVLPIWSSYSSTVKRSTAKDAGEAPNKHPDLKTDEKPVDKEDQVFLDELERLKRQEKDANDAAEALRKEFARETENLLLQAGAAKASSTNTVNTVSSTNTVNTVSTPVSTASTYDGLSFSDPTNSDQDDSEIPALEDIYQNPTDGIFTNSSYDDEGAVADFTNLETVVNVSPIPTSRITSIHPSTLILGDPQSAVQTRSKVSKSSGAHAFVSYIQKQRRNNHKDFQHCLFACFLSQNEPKKISEALEDESWVDAMQEELLQFKIQKVWILVDLPYGKKAIGTKWVYRNKKDERGVVVRNKARLVAQGHRQEEGIDYDEVFAPVARIEAIRIFLAFASYMGFIVYQMDVKSSFLYAKIDEEVYVSQPLGFINPKYPKKVYKVVKALYGLHQAPRAGYATLSTLLLKHEYRRGTIDKTLFIKKDKHDIILVQVYVDDIIFGSTKKTWCDEFEALMKGRFQMSSMGELTFFLGLQVKQKADGIFISQDMYVAEILKKFDFVSVKTASTPIETQKPLVKDEEASDVDVHLYRSMIGSLMYLTASRPDIMFAVCACSRFQVTPKTSHLSAVKRIFRYLKGKPKLGLWYPRVSSFDLEAYSDSDYAGANLDRKSTTGGCQFLGRRLISWQCKKQTIVATSTTEAEYVAAASCCGQVLWIQNQMLDYGFNFMNTKIYIDNESTICIVKNPVYHSKTKHIAIRHHFIRDAYEKKLIQVLKIHTDDNVADLLTKAFDVSRFQFLVVSIGMINP
ncbi:putative ribonuclease H-like domain-containing protein [Tanacetum coccineum]|uniref:Ribonuclease H-like domain-containing protein n=1 Tax=Tanacetum coccineum TaxID=301880 RepID=A0ABQ4XV56_9ASTR